MQRSERRAEIGKRLAEESFDVLVIGGGITGAGVARDAALRGLKVALVDKGDFGSGTSSRSSRLVHGGLRYLEMYQFGLVFESTHERARLMKLAPHLVRPLPFLMPMYEGVKPGPGLMRMGMLLYDTLASFQNYRRHKKLSAEAVSREEPALLQEGLRGAFRYYDCHTNDGRLTLENVLDAAGAGAACLNYARFEELRTERVEDREDVIGAVVVDAITGERIEIDARVVANAVGPWLRTLGESMGAGILPDVQPSKGVHIIVPRERFPADHAVVMTTRDGRVVFCVPWETATYVGTTDTEYDGDVDAVTATREDVDYLLEAANKYFPDLRLGVEDVIGTWAGLRPLVIEDSEETDKATYKVSREHLVNRDPRGVVTITGGKLTTYRIMAAQTVDAAVASLRERGGAPEGVGRCATKKRPLPGGVGLRKEAERAARLAELRQRYCDEAELPEAAVLHAFDVYGARAGELLKLALADPSLAKPIVDGLPYLWAEVRFAAEQEMVERLEDLLVRRTYLFYKTDDRALDVAAEVADRLGACLGWDETRKAQELEALHDLAASAMRFTKE